MPTAASNQSTTRHLTAPATADGTPTASPGDAAASAGTPAATPAVVARGLHLHTRRGIVYGPVDLDIPEGTLAVVQGPQGGGRSSLLLTLAGRMVPDSGCTLRVLGETLPRRRTAVQKRVAIAGFHGIDDLDEAVTVGEATRERLAWLSPWHRRVPRVDQATLAALVAPVFGDRPLPRTETLIWDLDEVDAMLLRIAFAMAQEPELLVVDDVDQVHDSVRRQTVWARLEAIAATGTTVVASVASLDEVSRMHWAGRPEQITLATGPHAVPAA
ncbi:ATP-binding cassette domain-containing protein [Cellulomonas soli]|uniref:ATP-binding cassette domain-containing protein n=1 Tax=Cellulomonas soli TaxID=931535 RepID=UPI003F83F3C4